MDLITIKPGMLSGIVEIPQLKGEREGDFYFASFFLVAGAIGNDITCKGISLESSQPDARILKIIESAGGEIVENENGVSAKMSAVMHSIEVDVKGIEEIIPAVSLLCAFCPGESRIFGASELCKERALLRGIASELSHLGVHTEVTTDGLSINGRQVLNGDGAYAWNSSEIATILTIGASRAEGEIRLMGTENLTDNRYKKFMTLYKKLNGGI